MDEHFFNLTELPDGYYEVEKTKKKINLDLPIHLDVFIPQLHQTLNARILLQFFGVLPSS